MPIQFTSLLGQARDLAPKQLSATRFMPDAGAARGWKLVDGSKASHSLTSPLRKVGDAVRGARGDNQTREQHAAEKTRFREDVRLSICEHFGTTLGTRLHAKAGLDKDHWPTPEQIASVNRYAATKLPPQSFQLLNFIHGDGEADLSRTLEPRINVLSPVQRREFDAALTNRVTSMPQFDAGTVSEQDVATAADDLIRNEFAPMFRTATEDKINGVCAAMLRDPASIVHGESADTSKATTAIEAARAFFIDHPDRLDYLNASIAVGDRARIELTSILLPEKLAQLRAPGPERDALRQKMGSRFSEADVDRLLQGAEHQIKTDPLNAAAKLLRGRFIEAHIGRQIAVDTLADVRASADTRSRLEGLLGNALTGAELDQAVAKAENYLIKDPQADLLPSLAADPVRAIARQIKLDLLKSEGLSGLHDLGMSTRDAGFALAGLERNGAPLDAIDYATIKRDPGAAVLGLMN